MDLAHQNEKAASRKQKRKAQRQKNYILTVVIILAAGLLVASLLLFSVKDDKNLDLQPPRLGQPLGDLTLNDLSGQPVSLKAYAGKPVLINTWATWCPPCRAEMPDLNAFFQQHQADGLVLLAINAGEDGQTVDRFIQSKGFTFPVLLDPQLQALNRLRINSFPTSILVGRDGLVKTVHVGMFTPQELQAEIGPFLKQ